MFAYKLSQRDNKKKWYPPTSSKNFAPFQERIFSTVYKAAWGNFEDNVKNVQNLFTDGNRLLLWKWLVQSFDKIFATRFSVLLPKIHMQIFREVGVSLGKMGRRQCTKFGTDKISSLSHYI